jgi:hypothetical protein
LRQEFLSIKGRCRNISYPPFDVLARLLGRCQALPSLQLRRRFSRPVATQHIEQPSLRSAGDTQQYYTSLRSENFAWGSSPTNKKLERAKDAANATGSTGYRLGWRESRSAALSRIREFERHRPIKDSSLGGSKVRKSKLKREFATRNSRLETGFPPPISSLFTQPPHNRLLDRPNFCRLMPIRRW